MLLGTKMDECLQQLLLGMRSRGTPVGTTAVMGAAQGILMNITYTLLEILFEISKILKSEIKKVWVIISKILFYVLDPTVIQKSKCNSDIKLNKEWA